MAKTGKKGERFEVVYRESDVGNITRVLKDKHTGVLYIYHSITKGGGLTVLVDENGKPLVDKSK